MPKFRSTRRQLRWAALASVSLFALPAAAATDGGEALSLLSLNPGGTTASNPVKPYYGNLRPFYGNLRPFYGNLRPFYGNLRPFWGNLRPFWGDTAAFYGDLKSFWATDNPVVSGGAPDYRGIGDFWNSTGETYQKTFETWNAVNPASTDPADYQGVANQLKDVIDASRDFWGAAVQAKTGKSFDEGFANKILAAYGIDLNDPASLAKLDQSDRAMFFLDWYDGLMNFSGTDHVDHWMKTVNWTPSLTKTQGAGGDTTIGILDQTFIGDAELAGNVVKSDGVSTFTNGHGAAVASLIIGGHDGKGVMGISPRAKVIAYNPFDETGTASWEDVTKGVRMLKASGASVVNMSLGVPGSTFDQGWNDVFANLSTTLILKNTVFVVAAGNDGVTQTKNVNWSPLNPSLIIVGSVDVDGRISNFSNRPGDACLSTLGTLCLPGSYLKDHFIVAPGEMILVDDGHGGVTRQIGTSFAAPLVSGAVALLHDRWPWLVNFPHETASIILNSAKDLGAPGVDEVYGHGLLDVTASQSPLDFNDLIWFTVQNGRMVPQKSRAVLATYKYEQQKAWDAQGAYFYAFEPIGLTTRDFAIPLSQKLIGQNVTTYNGAQEQFQAYLLARMDDWAASQTRGFASTLGFAASDVPVANAWGADMRVSFAPRTRRNGFRDEGPAYQSSLRVVGERSSVTMGFGDGAPHLVSQGGFAQAGDFDSERGGTNPLLGLASGGAFAGWSYKLSDRFELSTGALRRDDQRDTRLIPALGVVGNGAERYSADAQIFTLAWRPTAALTLTGGYTHLHEGSGLLGVQSFDPADFRKGSTTDGLTAGLAWTPAANLTFAASATLGRTRASGEGQSLAVDRGGLTTSAFEVGVAGRDLFAKGDVVRLSVSQPMFVERGRLRATTAQIVDRGTGEIGLATQSFSVSDQRRFAAEMLYALPISAGRGDVAFFGRAEARTADAPDGGYLAGARYRIAF